MSASSPWTLDHCETPDIWSPSPWRWHRSRTKGTEDPRSRTASSVSGSRARERSHIAMKHISIGGLDVSRIGLGAMSMSGYYNIGAGSDAESVRTIHRALDLGVTHLDTAEIYGPYRNEELVGPASKDRRERAVLAPKFGSASNSATGPG